MSVSVTLFRSASPADSHPSGVAGRPARTSPANLSRMTDSLTRTSQGKRERLLAAARSTFYEQGVERTTIADIARVADVPMAPAGG